MCQKWKHLYGAELESDLPLSDSSQRLTSARKPAGNCMIAYGEKALKECHLHEVVISVIC